MVDLRRRRYAVRRHRGARAPSPCRASGLPRVAAGFFGRVPSLSKKYETWSTSTHVEAGCEGCHVPPNAVARTTYRVRMVGEFYLSLVFRSREPKVFGTPTNEACLACHNDLRTVSPKGDLQIPHRAHVTVLKMKCVECHNYVVHEKSPEGKNTPPMAGCLRCHDGDTAKNGCTVCHTAEGGARDAIARRTGRSSTRRRPTTPSATAATSGPRTGASTATPGVRARTARTGAPRTGSRSRSTAAARRATKRRSASGATVSFPTKNFDPTLVIVK